jgi:hypothetical protein
MGLQEQDPKVAFSGTVKQISIVTAEAPTL